MRKFSRRSLITLATITTAMLAMTTPMRSQPKQETVSPARASEAQPQKPETIVNKKTNFVKMFEDIAIAPSFSPQEIELRGISGGTVATQKTSGRKSTETGICIGFIDKVPDHKITLSKPFRYLKLQVKSSGDTIMLVRGPGGIWCSDDVTDRNPVISGDWLAGTYEVWIGSYEENSAFPYLLKITEKP